MKKIYNTASAFPKYVTNSESTRLIDIEKYSPLANFIKNFSIEFISQTEKKSKNKNVGFLTHILSKVIHRGSPTFTPYLLEKALTEHLEKLNLSFEDLEKITDNKEIGFVYKDLDQWNEYANNALHKYVFNPFSSDHAELMLNQPYVDLKSIIVGDSEDELYKQIGNKFDRNFQLLFLRQVSFDSLVDDPIELLHDLDKSGIKNKEALVNEENRVDFAFEFGYNKKTKKPFRYIIEDDRGYQPHHDDSLKDKQRDLILEKYGWNTIRLKNDNDVENLFKRLEAHYQKFKEDNKDYTSTFFRNDPSFLIFHYPTLIQKSLSAINTLIEYEILSSKKKSLNILVNEEDYPAFIDALNLYYKLFDGLNGIVKNKVNLPNIELFYFGEKPILNLKHTKIKVFHSKPKGKFDYIIDNSFLLQSHQKGERNISLDVYAISKGSKIRIRKHFSLKNNFKMTEATNCDYKPYAKIDKKNLCFFLNEIFRKKSFLPQQYEVIECLLNRNNSIALLPTGAGKSIIFQLAGILLPGLTLVIDPLKALIDDQFINLKNLGLSNIDKINSSCSFDERTIFSYNIREGRILFSYISPERLQTSQFRTELKSVSSITPISLTVIDEAHIISEWGHDFRTSYLQMGRNLDRYCSENKDKKTTIVGLTGTASENVLNDIKNELMIKDEQNIISPSSFDRKEIHFEVIKVDDLNDKYDALNEILTEKIPKHFTKSRNQFYNEEKNSQSNGGVVFTSHTHKYASGSPSTKIHSTRKVKNFMVDQKILNSDDIAIYDGKVPDSQRDNQRGKILRDFKQNDLSCVVATKAFGMGIDKPNISYVIHFTAPMSIEGFYQEAGRAGRHPSRYKKTNALSYSIYNDQFYEEAMDILNSSTNVEANDKLDRYGFEEGGDLFNQLWFILNAYKDKDKEIYDMQLLWRKFFKKKKSLIIREADMRKLYSNKEYERFGKKASPTDTQRMLFRLMSLNIIDDYAVNFRIDGIESFDITLSQFSPDSIKNSLRSFLMKYDSPKDVEIRMNKYSSILSLVEKLQNNKIDLLEESIYLAMNILVEYVYDDIYTKKKTTLQTMVAKCHEYKNPDDFRSQLLNYLQENEFTESIRGWSQKDFEDIGINEIEKTIENVEKRKRGLFEGAVDRALDNYGSNPALHASRLIIKIIETNSKEEEIYTRSLTFTSAIDKDRNDGKLSYDEIGDLYALVTKQTVYNRKDLEEQLTVSLIESCKNRKVIKKVLEEKSECTDYVINSLSYCAVKKFDEIGFLEELKI